MRTDADQRKILVVFHAKYTQAHRQRFRCHQAIRELRAYENGVTLDFSRPGKPTDNAFVESFKGRLRDECLNTHWFLSLEDARAKIDALRRDYKESRPHTSLGWLTPIEYAAAAAAKATE